MNLLTNLKSLKILWWIIIPILVAQLLISFGVLFLKSQKIDTLHVKSKKNTHLYSFPKFFTTTLKQKVQTKTEKHERLGNLKLKACYVEKGREFVIVSEDSKTVFVDLDSKYKGAKLVFISRDFATFEKNGKKIKLTLVSKISKQRVVRSVEKVMLEDDKYIDLKRENLKQYVKSPEQALRDVRFREVRDNKEFLGLRLSFVRRGSLFDRMKLKKNEAECIFHLMV